MKRPVSVTLLSLYLGSAAVNRLSRLADETLWPLTDPWVMGDVLSALAAIAAGAAGVGLWRMQRWAYRPLAVAGGLMISRMIVDQLTVARGVGLPLAAATGLMVVVVLFAVHWARMVVQEPKEEARVGMR